MRLSALALCALGLASAHGAEHSASLRACVLRPRTQTAPKRPDTIFALILREQCRHAAALGPMNVRIEDPADDPSDDPVWGNESADSYPGDDPYPAAVRPGGARTLGEPTRGPATVLCFPYLGKPLPDPAWLGPSPCP